MTVLLDVRGLRKRYGGVAATDGVDLQVHSGELHALIGPNGAGKTTLVALLAGQVASDAGQIVFAGHDITHASAHRRARLGLARSFQITRLFKSFSVAQHLALALQAASGSSLGAWSPVARERALAQQAHASLAQLGLTEKADARIEQLSHGQRRALEVGMAVVAQPRLVLLDEPLAGMGPEEAAQMEALIAHLHTRTTVLLIEHDVDAVFRLASRVTVLVSGQVIASGAPAAVRADARVISAYLGQE